MLLSLEFIRALDDSVRADLQSLHDRYFDELVVYGILVAVGVVFELPEVINDIREAFSTWEPSKAVKKKVSVMGMIGWLMVASGVGGETIYEALVSAADTRSQVFESISLTDTQARASAANERAGEAIEHAAQLDIALVAARTGLEKEQQATVKAQKDGIEAQRKLNAALIDRALWRDVDPESVPNLKALPPAKAEIQYRAGDPETFHLAVRIRAALREAGWTVTEPAPIFEGNGAPSPPPGVTAFSGDPRGGAPFDRTIQIPSGLVMAAEMMSININNGAPISELEVKLAVLMSAAQARENRFDASLATNSFRIVIGQRPSR